MSQNAAQPYENEMKRDRTASRSYTSNPPVFGIIAPSPLNNPFPLKTPNRSGVVIEATHKSAHTKSRWAARRGPGFFAKQTTALLLGPF